MNRQKEIIWLTENYPPQKGGMSQSCDRIINGLRQTGEMIHVIHFTNRKEAYRPELQEQGTYTAVPVKADESHTLHLAYNYLQQKNFKNSILVAFGGYLPMLAAPVYKAWLECKLLLMIRGNDFDASVFSPKKRQMMFDALQYSDWVTCISRAKTYAIEKLFPGSAINYVPNGIETELWHPLPSDVDIAGQWKQENSAEKLVLGCFGHLKEKKGLDILMQALKSPALQSAFQLLLIGDVAPQVQEELQRENISYHCLPFVERMNLIKYYLCCDGMVIPSHYDGMPNVLLEAGLLDIPVIASAKDGMLDVISHEENGLLFNAGDFKGLREVMFAFLKLNSQRRNELGKKLGCEIRQHYTSTIETEKYLQIIKSLRI